MSDEVKARLVDVVLDFAQITLAEGLAGWGLFAVTDAITADNNDLTIRTRFKQTFGLELPHWQIGLQHILDQIL